MKVILLVESMELGNWESGSQEKDGLEHLRGKLFLPLHWVGEGGLKGDIVIVRRVHVLNQMDEEGLEGETSIIWLL